MLRGREQMPYFRYWPWQLKLFVISGRPSAIIRLTSFSYFALFKKKMFTLILKLFFILQITTVQHCHKNNNIKILCNNIFASPSFIVLSFSNSLSLSVLCLFLSQQCVIFTAYGICVVLCRHRSLLSVV